jgi:hypothetical protein
MSLAPSRSCTTSPVVLVEYRAGAAVAVVGRASAETRAAIAANAAAENIFEII